MRTTFTIATIMFASNALFADTAKVSALVMDDKEMLPIANVTVTAYFTVDIGWRAWSEPSPPNTDSAMTGFDGRCRLSGKTNCGKVGCWVNTPPLGYYSPRRGWGHTYTKKSLLGVWQPDNLVATIKLQRVEHPVALFVKQFNVGGSDSVRVDLFTKGNGCLQLDMLKGEWLPPVGNGEHADVIFTRAPRKDLGTGTNARGITAAAYRDSMSVKFVGDDNGFVEVASLANARLRIRSAPENGYRHDYVCWKERTKNLKHVSSFDEERNFVFRIRTERDKNGRITSAYYGKIYGDICFKKLIGVDVEAVAAPSFLYYLNPNPLDRNLEWDMKNNLCPNPGNVGKQP